MKGKRGESPMSGVSINTSTVPQTAKGNIMSAARKRKRGGAVAPLKVDGSMPKARLDKPKRARGGATEDANVTRQRAKANSQVADMIAKRPKASSGLGDAGAATLKSIQKTFDDDAKPKRARGGAASNGGGGGLHAHGKIGADTSPSTHAAAEKPMRGHKTQPNIT